ncbi:LANO_0H01552g1_1 [Lachancea nothofagi CBS 11611]|uniref:LANO_0H01552g1_1 n=1 Tax=Lachancea nothofagi CBS 11611 TaxID=1266666 RepID=A0A1G4KKZ8_9SACH|nr:LANO_0H01552g1_1 [Lachancea nothofagi CBS 11611]
MLTGRNVIPDFESVSSPLKSALTELLSVRVINPKELRAQDVLSTAQRGYYYEIVKHLTQSKIYVSVNSKEGTEDDVSRKKAKSYRLMSQEELVIKIWDIVADQIDQCADDVIADFIENLALEVDFEAGFVRLWPGCCLGKFKVQVKLITEAFSYLTNTFPFIFDRIPGVQSVTEFADYRLVESALSVLDNKIDRTVDEMIRTVRELATAKDETQGLARDDEGAACSGCLQAFLRVMSKCNLIVMKEQRASVKRIYVKNLEIMLRNIKISFDKEFLNKLKSLVITEYEVASCISQSLPLEAKKTILNKLLFDADHLRSILTVYAFTPGFNREFESLKFAHFSANKSQQFYDILARETTDKFKASYLKQCNMSEILAFCESLYALEDPTCHKLIKRSLKEVFDGELRILEPLLKTLDSIIKNCYQLLISGQSKSEVQIENDKSKVHAVWTILNDFDLVEPFFELFFEKSFFRRVLLMGEDYLRFMDHSLNVEREVLENLELHRASRDFLPQLSKLRSDLKCTKLLNCGFNEKEISNVHLIPMIFERNNVPSTFQEISSNDITLPTTLQQIWNRFQSFYQKSDSKAGLKPLILQNALHHLEVQTDFKLEEGSFLILEVTLIQASVLEFFNTYADLTVAKLVKLLNVSVTQVNLALVAFVDVQLLKLSGGTFTVNADFKADPRKIKNGKFRVVNRSVPRPPTRQGGPAVKTNTMWVKELLRASIVRSLKGFQGRITFEELKLLVEKQNSGFSLGEFKTALSDCRDFYDFHDSRYSYKP